MLDQGPDSTAGFLVYWTFPFFPVKYPYAFPGAPPLHHSSCPLGGREYEKKAQIRGRRLRCVVAFHREQLGGGLPGDRAVFQAVMSHTSCHCLHPTKRLVLYPACVHTDTGYYGYFPYGLSICHLQPSRIEVTPATSCEH